MITLIAQGSRRPRSDRRVVLQPFSLLKLSWIRRGELGRLTHAEVALSSLALSGEAVLAGFYLNELLLRLMGRDNPNDLIFSCYTQCLSDLSNSSNTSRSLRLFELRFLEALGYGLGLLEDVETGEEIHSDCTYGFKPEYGFTIRTSLREERLDDLDSLRSAKRLLQYVLKSYLGNRPLSTRTVLKDVYARGLEL